MMLQKGPGSHIFMCSTGAATIEAIVGASPTNTRDLRYQLAFRPLNQRVEVVDEVIEETTRRTQLLPLVDSDKARRRCPHCERLFSTLTERLEGT